MNHHEIEHTAGGAVSQSEPITGTLAELRRLVGALAVLTGETPRSILEDEFKHAPSDDFWRARVGADT